MADRQVDRQAEGQHGPLPQTQTSSVAGAQHRLCSSPTSACSPAASSLSCLAAARLLGGAGAGSPPLSRGGRKRGRGRCRIGRSHARSDTRAWQPQRRPCRLSSWPGNATTSWRRRWSCDARSVWRACDSWGLRRWGWGRCRKGWRGRWRRVCRASEHRRIRRVPCSGCSCGGCGAKLFVFHSGYCCTVCCSGACASCSCRRRVRRWWSRRWRHGQRARAR